MIRQLTRIYHKAKIKSPEIIFHSGVIFLFSQAGLVFAALASLFIFPRYLNPHELGLVTPIQQYAAFGALPLAVLSALIIQFVSKYEAKKEFGKLKCMVRDVALFGFFSMACVILFFFFSFDSFALRMNISSRGILYLLFLHLCVSCWLPFMNLLLRALRQFFVLAVNSFIAPIVLLFASIILLPRFGFKGYLWVLILQSAGSLFLCAYFIIRTLSKSDVPLTPYFHECKGVLKKYFFLFSLCAAVYWLWNLLPSFVVKHFLNDADAAGYYFVYRLSLIPSYVISPMFIVLLPVISSKYESGLSTLKTIKWTVLLTLLFGMIIVLLMHYCVPYIFEVIPAWKPYYSYSRYVWLFAIYVVMVQICGIIASDISAKWVFTDKWYGLSVTLVFSLAVYCLFGWGGVKGVIPLGLWEFVNDHFKPSISLLAYLLLLSQLAQLCILLYWFRKVNRDELGVEL